MEEKNKLIKLTTLNSPRAESAKTNARAPKYIRTHIQHVLCRSMEIKSCECVSERCVLSLRKCSGFIVGEFGINTKISLEINLILNLNLKHHYFL